MTVERINLSDKSRDEWLALREGLVTGSDIAATPLLNCHAYKSPLRLYHEKAKLIDLPPQSDTKVLKRGRIYEPAVGVALVEERPDLRVEKCHAFYRDTARRIGCTPDYFVRGDKRGIGCAQFKTCNRSVFNSLYGDNTAPLGVVAQNLLEVILTDSAFGMIVALCVDPYDAPLVICDVPRHPAAEKKILDAAADFWQHIDDKREPEATPRADLELLTLLYPREDKGKVVDLSHDNKLVAMLHERAELNDKIKLAEARCEEIETEVKDRMREAERIVGLDEFRVTWKVTHYPEHTVPARDRRVLRILDRRE